jgi:hypothetical protein
MRNAIGRSCSAQFLKHATLISMGTVAMLAGCDGAPTALPTSPASLNPAFDLQTCSGSGCNGLDPEAYGCRGDASELASVELTDGYGMPMGRVEVYSSATCDAIWTEVQSYHSGADIVAEITDPGPTPWHAYSSSGTGSWLASPMLYDPSPSGSWGYGSVTKTFASIFYCVDDPYLHCPPEEHSGWSSATVP